MSFPSGLHVSVGSSVFTSTADAVYRGTVTLVQVDLPEFDGNAALTLRLATQKYVDPDGYPWDPALKEPPTIDHGGGFLSVDWQPVDAVVTVQDRRLNGQGESETFASYFGSYPFIGARVQILQAFDNLSSVSEFKTLFDGEIAEVDGIDLGSVTFHCVQDRDWNTPFPPRTVTADEYADAPKGTLGTAIPVVLGDWETDNRYLDGSAGTDEAVYAGIARGACPMLCVSSPTGASVTLPKHLISDDEIDQGPLAGGAPYDQWYMYESALDCLVGPGLGTLTNPTDGPATTVLQSVQVTGAILPVEVVTPATTADNPEWCLRKDKKYNLGDGYTYLNHTGKGYAAWALPDVAPLGKMLEANVRIYYQKPTTAGTQIKVSLYNTALLAETASILSGVSTGYTSDGYEDIKVFADTGTAIPNGWEDIKNCEIRIETRTAGHEAKIHHVVLNITYVATARTEKPGTSRDVTSLSSKRFGSIPGRDVPIRFTRQVTSPDVVSFDSALYGFPRGRKDTAAGIYTGTANALIEHPVDIVRYLLKRWQGVDAGSITENTGDFGAFPDAKSALSAYRFRAILSSRQDVSEHIAAIGNECLVWFKRMPTLPGAPWVAIPWELGSAVNYRTESEPFLFYRARAHVVQGSFSVGHTRISGVVNTLRVNYDWDPRTNTYGDQVYITPDGSRVHLIGSNFADDATRTGNASDSASLYGTKELVLSMKMVKDAGTASDVMKRLFDLRVNPRLTVRFRTFVNAYDLNRGHLIGFADDWDTRLAYPKAGSDGSWSGKLFRVTNVKRLRESPTEYAVEAVEAD